MKKIALILSFCAFAHFFYSQDFSYSFSGSLTEHQQTEINSKILNLPGIKSCKLKYKSDSQRGEVVISVDEPKSRSENDSEFSPVLIKELFIGQGIEPMEFRQLK